MTVDQAPAPEQPAPSEPAAKAQGDSRSLLREIAESTAVVIILAVVASLVLSGILILGVTTATVVSYFNDAVGRSGSSLRRARQHDGTRDEEERQ